LPEDVAISALHSAKMPSDCAVNQHRSSLTGTLLAEWRHDLALMDREAMPDQYQFDPFVAGTNAAGRPRQQAIREAHKGV
jgi:hypothetical protein